MADMKPFSIDFSKEETKGSKWYCSPGRYAAKITGVDRGTTSNGNPKLTFELQVTSPSAKGTELKSMVVLTPQSLWKLRQYLEAMGYKVPKSAVTIKPSEYIGKTIGVEVKDREYEGKNYSNVDSVFPVSELTASSEDESDGLEEELPL